MRRLTRRGMALITTLVLALGSAAPVGAATYQFTLKGCAYDGAFATKVCVEIDYNIHWRGNSEGPYYGDVEQYRTTFTRLDDSINFSSSDVFGGVIGVTCPGQGGGPLNTSQHFTRLPTSGVTYTDVPSWHGKYSELWSSPPFIWIQKVTATLTWRRGTGTYHTVISVQLPDGNAAWTNTTACP